VNALLRHHRAAFVSVATATASAIGVAAVATITRHQASAQHAGTVHGAQASPAVPVSPVVQGAVAAGVALPAVAVIDAGPNTFRVSGDASSLLAPGTTSPIDVVVDNPFPFALRIDTVTVTAAGGNPCPADTNLVALPSSFGNPVVVPQRSTRTLSSLGVPAIQWPALQMVDRDVDQASCRGATFSLSYTAAGSKP